MTCDWQYAELTNKLITHSQFVTKKSRTLTSIEPRIFSDKSGRTTITTKLKEGWEIYNLRNCKILLTATHLKKKIQRIWNISVSILKLKSGVQNMNKISICLLPSLDDLNLTAVDIYSPWVTLETKVLFEPWKHINEAHMILATR